MLRGYKKKKREVQEKISTGELLTLETVAERLLVHVKTAQRFCREGTIKAGKPGKRWLISPEALADYLKKIGVN